MGEGGGPGQATPCPPPPPPPTPSPLKSDHGTFSTSKVGGWRRLGLAVGSWQQLAAGGKKKLGLPVPAHSPPPSPHPMKSIVCASCSSASSIANISCSFGRAYATRSAEKNLCSFHACISSDV